MTLIGGWPASMTLKLAADYLSISEEQLRKIINAGALRCHTLTDKGDKHVSRTELDAFINRREQRGVVREAS